MKNSSVRVEKPGAEKFSNAKMMGECLRDSMLQHDDFYLFSPDETTSNKLDAVFENFDRAWQLPKEAWDDNLASDGRIIEMLSENTLFAVLEGHILSGGKGAFTSYEAFLPIITSQLAQYMKFLKQSDETSWRPKYEALNILSTSCWQRQDHNGYTHQNPGAVSNLLAKPINKVNCLFPADDMATRAAWEWSMESENVVNLITFNKIEMPRWTDLNQARFQIANRGAMVYQFMSDKDPDYIFTAAGDIPTRETLQAMAIIRSELPKVKMRFVNISALSYSAIGTTDNKLTQKDFDEYYTSEKPIIANFHGYPETLRVILSHYADSSRLKVYGYQDEGSTTTPLDELVRNRCSRFDIAIDFFIRLGFRDIAKKYIDFLADNKTYAQLHGKDKIEL